MSQTSEASVNPNHYKQNDLGTKLECVNYTRHMGFSLGNAFKYLWRVGEKKSQPIMRDLKKARWYLIDVLGHRSVVTDSQWDALRELPLPWKELTILSDTTPTNNKPNNINASISSALCGIISAHGSSDEFKGAMVSVLRDLDLAITIIEGYNA